MAGWDICCKWKDGSTSWENLPNLKKLHQIQIAKYAIAQGIDHKSAFHWCIPYILKKRRIIFMVKWCNVQYLKRTHNVGLELPNTVIEAIAIIKKIKIPSGRCHREIDGKCEDCIPNYATR